MEHLQIPFVRAWREEATSISYALKIAIRRVIFRVDGERTRIQNNSFCRFKFRRLPLHYATSKVGSRIHGKHLFRRDLNIILLLPTRRTLQSNALPPTMYQVNNSQWVHTPK